MRKVLILAYRFPPQGGISVHRTVKFARYLRQFGWQPVIHTVSNPFWHLRDESLQREIPPETPVYRTRTFEFERLEQRLGSWLGKSSASAKPASEQKPAQTASGTDAPQRRRGLVASFQQFVHRHLLIPDPQVAWIPWAFAKSLYIARREKIDLIYTSSPPNSSQVLGLWLKRALEKPWVADFRDPWTEGIRRKQTYVGNARRQRLEEGWERAVAQQADHLIVNTEKNQEQFLEKYPFLATKITTLTNGFDAADFTHLSASKKFLPEDCFHLTLTGNIETMFDAAPFFRAVHCFLADNAEARTHFRINLVGTKRGKYDALIHDLQLEEVVRYIAYVPHADSVQYLADSDVLFLCQIPEYESAVVKIPGKLFEYLYLRKPVLALTLPGVTTTILDRVGLGVVVHPNDTSGIQNALRDLYAQWQQRQWRFTPDHAAIDGFSREKLTERLSAIFDHTLGLSATTTRKDPERIHAHETVTSL